ncbi:MAG: NAD kinase [Bacteroidales bacterium]|nr:NAD kinase [Bacteroidales bacterium]
MRIAVFGKSFSNEHRAWIQQVVTGLEKNGAKLFFYTGFYNRISAVIEFQDIPDLFEKHEDIRGKVDFLFSIGGDGTLLDTITLVRDSGIPLLGINLGRLGFLSSISKDKIDWAIGQLGEKKYTLDQRTLIRLETENSHFGILNYALNEITVYRKNPFSMLTIQAYINGEFLNSYWADGLIVATPTGSTAYSLSSGGPIILPGSSNFVITPIATHNLSVRPVVIPDTSVITIRVVGRNKDFYASLDSRPEVFNSSEELTLKKEAFKINLLRMEGEEFFKTIREKLMWGLDIRN